jgi:acetyl esterase/lipase
MASINPTKTVSYKTIGDLSIPMDIYIPENAHKAPILLWFHGGGLLYVIILYYIRSETRTPR